DYEICVSCNSYSNTQTELISNVKLGKQISYDDIAFQIYVAHANESCWDLCKRLHITQEKLMQYNKENPTTYNGGEKIIVYR
ncbi:MAG: LysM peptidoglycan-binding domain-containing protein, partial [Clostridia bacterium]|nr:LysM peptidoglycan-binding domain-containing protein [Clostridia bacterium]